jgi:hypothetical protein
VQFLEARIEEMTAEISNLCFIVAHVVNGNPDMIKAALLNGRH